MIFERNSSCFTQSIVETRPKQSSWVDIIEELFTSVLVGPHQLLPQTFKSTIIWRLSEKTNYYLSLRGPLNTKNTKLELQFTFFSPQPVQIHLKHKLGLEISFPHPFETNNLQICKFFVPPFSKSFRIFNFFKKRNPPSNFRRFWCPFLTYCQNSFSSIRFRWFV